MNIKMCPACGQSLHEGFLFCPTDGTYIGRRMTQKEPAYTPISHTLRHGTGHNLDAVCPSGIGQKIGLGAIATVALVAVISALTIAAKEPPVSNSSLESTSHQTSIVHKATRREHS